MAAYILQFTHLDYNYSRKLVIFSNLYNSNKEPTNSQNNINQLTQEHPFYKDNNTAPSTESESEDENIDSLQS